jgi:hypothetical protein
VIGGTTYDTEIVWRDGDLVYALSDNTTGVFNEINVGDDSDRSNAGFPAFLGQLRVDDSADVSLITPFAGQHSLTRQYAGPTVAWTSMTIQDTGAIVFNGGAGRDIALADISAVTDRLTCCGRIDIAVDADLNDDGMTDNYDGLSFYVNSTGALSSVTYYLGDELGDLVGARFDAATLPTHDGTALPETSRLAASAAIEGGATVALDIEMHSSSYGSPTFNNINISGEVTENSTLQQRIAIRLEGGNDPLISGESYDCYEDSGDGWVTRLVVKTASPFTSDYSSANGGNCRITLTTVTVSDETNPRYLLVEGTFTAELYPNKRNNPKVTIDDGVFRWVPPAP